MSNEIFHCVDVTSVMWLNAPGAFILAGSCDSTAGIFSPTRSELFADIGYME